MRKFSFMLSLLLMVWILSFPASVDAATGMAFLKNGVDARSTMFGEAMVSHVQDASACYWNPAGLSQINKTQLVISHVESFADLRHEYASGVQPLFEGNLVAGFYFNGFWADDWQGYNAEAEPIGQIGFSTYTTGFALGHSLGSSLHLGGGLKMINQSLADYSASGWSADLGLQWANADNPLSFGLAVRNIGPAMHFEIGGETGNDFDLPMTIQGGVSLSRSLSTAGEVLISLEGRSIKDQDEAILGGIEYSYRNTLSLGLGYMGGSDTRDISVGLGVNHGRFAFNWAFVPVKEDLGDENRFSMRLEL